jgi:hypothetical protein
VLAALWSCSVPVVLQSALDPLFSADESDPDGELPVLIVDSYSEVTHATRVLHCTPITFELFSGSLAIVA